MQLDLKNTLRDIELRQTDSMPTDVKIQMEVQCMYKSTENDFTSFTYTIYIGMVYQ